MVWKLSETMEIGTMVGISSEVLHGKRNVGSAMLLVVFQECHSPELGSNNAAVSLPNILLGLGPPHNVGHMCRRGLRHGREMYSYVFHAHAGLGFCDGGSVAIPRCIRLCDAVIQAFPPAFWLRPVGRRA